MVTSDFKDFGKKQIAETADILKMYVDGKLSPVARDYFYDDGIEVMFNNQSGFVFLSNSDYQALGDNSGMLDLWITTSWTGQEGFLDDLVDDALSGGMERDDMEDLLAYKNFIDIDDLEELEKRIENS